MPKFPKNKKGGTFHEIEKIALSGVGASLDPPLAYFLFDLFSTTLKKARLNIHLQGSVIFIISFHSHLVQMTDLFVV